jgi:predicted RNA-binding protein (virulence factor B family)
MIYDHSQIGYKAIINDNNSGLLFETDVFRPLKTGDRLKGFIKRVREDSKIDLCLHEPGYEKVEGVSQVIYECVKAEGGFLPITNHSSPQVIYELFGISKKTYKMAVGALYKKRLITIETDGLKIREKNH